MTKTTTTMTARPCDGRLELTRVLKEKTNYYSDIHPFAYINTNHHAPVMTIFRNSHDVEARENLTRPCMEYVEGNVETRVFITPIIRKTNFTIQVTNKYIHIS